MQKKLITAILGPTNTGKTFQAIETMLSFDSGMIGFPLRLLAREAYDKLSEKGEKFSWIYSVALNPLPEEVLNQLKSKKLVIVPELNYQGQWSSILRMEGINAISVTQYTGLPFKPTDLSEKILQKIKEIGV